MRFTYTHDDGEVTPFEGDNAMEDAQRMYWQKGRVGTIAKLSSICAPFVREGSFGPLTAAVEGFADHDDAVLITYDEDPKGVSWYDDSALAKGVWEWCTGIMCIGATTNADAKYHNSFSVSCQDVMDAPEGARLAMAMGTMAAFDPTVEDMETHGEERTHFGKTEDIVVVRGGGRDLRADEGIVTQMGRAGTVSEEAAERIKRHEQVLNAMGIALPPPIYTPGSRVNSWGVDNFRVKRQDWADQPPTDGALLMIAEHVKGEAREDTIVPAHELTMLDDGSIKVMGEGTFTVEQGGLKGLLSIISKDAGWGYEGIIETSRLVFPRGATLMTEMPPDLRAHVFNRMLKERGNWDQEVMLRTRKYNGDDRSIFAAQSSSYGAFDADQVATAIAGALQDTGARGEVVYNPRTTSLRAHAMWAADNVVDFAAGDIFKVGGTFRTNDAGGGSIRGDAGAWRNLCLNLIIIGSGKANVFRVAHKGSMDEVASQIRAGMAKMQEGFSVFLNEWGYLRPNVISDVTLWGERFETAEQALEWGVEHKRITAEVKRNVLLESILTAHAEEPGNTLADIVNAITRAAHMDLINDCARDSLERQAGMLVPVLARQAKRENLKTLNA